MRNENFGSFWLTIAVIIVGIGSLVVLGIASIRGMPVSPSDLKATQTTPAPTQQSVAVDAEIEKAEDDTQSVATPEFTVPAPDGKQDGIVQLPTITPSPTPTLLPSLALPEVGVPENGQVYLIQPTNSAAVGWARADDDVTNHLGDYNIFAGLYNGQEHIGTFQFDLSSVPPGTPILYADVTLTGLVSGYLKKDGIWNVQMLNDWMDVNWHEKDFYSLARDDSGTTLLNSPVGSNDLAIGKSNTFSIPPEGLSLLEARLFAGKVSFRIVGPHDGEDNLFGWDSGFGERTLGRAPVLRIVTGGPTVEGAPSPTPNYVIITPVPNDGEALFNLAAARLTATAEATPVFESGTPVPTQTPTSLPPNWVTPVIVTNTPTPQTEATAYWQAQVATAQAIVMGTATATPPNVWTATPTPLPPAATPTPLVVPIDQLTATPTPTTTPGALPDLLRGKILFYSDRSGGAQLMVMDPDGGNVSIWTGGAPDWIYAQAVKGEDTSPDRQSRVIVSDEQIRTLQLWTLDLNTGTKSQFTHLDAITYDPVWSPVGNTVAFVSPTSGNDEIYLINTDGSGLTQLTHNDWEWDKHPSWSPDGSQITFWSNRETERKQIWVMNADGTNVRNLSNNAYNDWDPVWVK